MSHPRKLPAILAACISALAAAPALGADAATGAPDCEHHGLAGFSLQVENDLFPFYHHTDRWYTSGLLVSTTWRPACTPAPFAPARQLGQEIIEAFPSARAAAAPAALSFLVGQNIYTPRDIGIATPQLSDRPWGGWLYAGVSAGALVDPQTHRYVEAKLGVIGPPSLARQGQDVWHALIGSPHPEGWDNQLRPTLGAQAGFLETRRLQGSGLLSRFGLHYAWGGTVGNTRTQAKLGFTAIWPAAETQAGLADEGDFFLSDYSGNANGEGRLRNIQLFVQAQLTAVAWNGFLQGDTFAGHSDIHIKRLVGMGAFGISAPIDGPGRHRMVLTVKRKTPEFSSSGISSGDAVQTWGSVSYVRSFD